MKLQVSSSPHIRGKNSTGSIMRDVLIALLPAVLASVFIFGIRALVLELVCMAASAAGEGLWRLITRQHCTLKDCSCLVTGLLLALTLPVNAPYWIAAVGGFVAIVIVKGLCGGIGQNVFNPALAARAILLALWPVHITRFAAVGTKVGLMMEADAVTSPTPLHEMQMLTVPDVSLADMFLGNIGGCIGEVSALALLIGGAYLVIRRVISLRIPLSYIGTVAVLSLIFAKGDNPLLWMLYSVLGGGVILGAFFMATDYSSSPVTPKGQIIYGIGIGALTVFFRYTGLFPEGVTYAILLMNAAAWLIDQRTAPRRFGIKKGAV